ncbi:MAG: hypothetical protein ACI9TV_002460 [Sulfurimonas sp.]|jgi:hypothetical protein|uniref:DUF3373 family protein n=1 Tax=Sulfurimonas sp. TaxID=2022749 RepID=UPI0039E68739
MKNKVVLSSIVAALLVSPLNALNMLDRFEAMEKEMKALKAEILLLKSSDNEDSEDSAEIAENEEITDDDDSEDSEEGSVEEQLEEIKENLTDLNIATSGSHLKFGVDYRFAADNLQYKMADGSKKQNDAFLTNRLWINMDWAATDTVSFHGQLAYNKAFGNRGGTSTQNEFENFDWISNENAYDDTLRVRTAYFYYADEEFLGSDIPWTFSIGRRSSTNGAPINLREDDGLSSPLAHTMNVEFDGLSSKFSFNEWVDGMKLQFCAGRGLSNASTKFSAAPYAEDESSIPNIDLAGIVFTGYDDGQYLLKTQYYFAHNLIDVVNPMNYSQGFKTVGNMHSATALFQVNGIGSEINDFLDDSIFFMSGAVTKTDPDANEGMLGSADGESVTGYSYWLGAQVPSLMSEDGRMGVEYNHGSKHWRSITYGEDTNVGSKIAARGDAYELYFTEYLVEDILSLQLRYTYIDYDYTGSNGFFGNTTGSASKITSDMPNGSNYVDKAQDIRFSIRYKY